jgi:Rieske Fe-S protein
MKPARSVLLLFVTIVVAVSLGAGVASAQDKPDKPAAQLHASAIQVAMVESNEIQLPIQFQLALYENLITQITKTGKFQHVYRDGDKDAASASDLVVLHSNVYGFKQGSEGKRQVTTVSGATQIKVHVSFLDKDGKSELSQDVVGNVRFIGGNLRATFDYAKKVAQVISTNFQ